MSVSFKFTMVSHKQILFVNSFAWNVFVFYQMNATWSCYVMQRHSYIFKYDFCPNICIIQILYRPFIFNSVQPLIFNK